MTAITGGRPALSSLETATLARARARSPFPLPAANGRIA